jgi:iron(III)-enterobactin esterase
MLIEELDHIKIEQRAIASAHLKRQVIIDLYIPKDFSPETNLLLINDGQDLPEMPFDKMLEGLLASNQIQSLFCVGIHAGKDRRNEYGTASVLDYAGRGAKAAAYRRFVLEELLPFIHTHYGVQNFRQTSYAGFSLGGLSALDTVWHYPDIFSVAGVFSGSLWWRSKDIGEGYDDDKHRIIHQLIRAGKYSAGLRFYFTTGSMDETADRNKNGIIDSIDDTLDLIKELKKKGYKEEADIKYINYETGKHDVATWGKAMPAFLLWGWSKAEIQKENLASESC